MTIEFASPGGDTLLATDMTDAEGSFQGSIVWEAGDEGIWNLFAYPTADGTCIDKVTVVVAAAAGPATPTPSATASPAAALLPDTAVADGDTGSWVPIALPAMAAVASSAALFARRYAIAASNRR